VLLGELGQSRVLGGLLLPVRLPFRHTDKDPDAIISHVQLTLGYGGKPNVVAIGAHYICNLALLG